MVISLIELRGTGKGGGSATARLIIDDSREQRSVDAVTEALSCLDLSVQINIIAIKIENEIARYRGEKAMANGIECYTRIALEVKRSKAGDGVSSSHHGSSVQVLPPSVETW